MARSVYVTGMEPASGKSLVTLGLVEALSLRTARLGFFRPVITPLAPGRPDNDIELIRRRYRLSQPYEELYAYTSDEAGEQVASGHYADLLSGVLQAYKRLEPQCDVVVVEGSDFTGATASVEFDANAQIANSLGATVLMVVSGHHATAEAAASATGLAHRTLAAAGCTLLATVVNRVDPSRVDDVAAALLAGMDSEAPPAAGGGRAPVFVVPDLPELGMPTVGEVLTALGGRLRSGDADGLTRQVRAVKVAAMTLPHFLDHVSEGVLVITPGDRSDVIMGTLAAAASAAMPHPCGLVLAGGIEPEPQVQRLVDGLAEPSFPIVGAAGDTYDTASRVAAVTGLLTPGDERKAAAALGHFAAHVDTAALLARMDVVRSTRVTPLMFEYDLIERASGTGARVVLPEGDDDRVLRAAEILRRRGVAELVLLGEEGAVRTRAAALGLEIGDVPVVDPATAPQRAAYAETYARLRAHKGMTPERAYDLMSDVSWFGTMMVQEGEVGGMVSGAAHTTGDTIRPALQIIRTVPGVSVVSSVFLMCLADRVVAYGDCAVNPDPDAGQLADIAISSAATAARFGIEPRVAMLSYSTGTSGSGADVDKVREATALVRERRPDLAVDGPLQYDAAVDASVAASKLPGSAVAGQATVFVFPDLNTGNNTYKAVQRTAGAVAIGPVLQGLRKPVNDLSRGCTVPDIVNTVAITAIQAGAPALVG